MSYPREHIRWYLRCPACEKDLFNNKRYKINESSREYGRMECGFTRNGFQVWCLRHDINMINIDFDGDDLTVDITRYGSFLKKGGATKVYALKQKLVESQGECNV